MDYNQNHWNLGHSTDNFDENTDNILKMVNDTFDEYNLLDKVEKISEFSSLRLPLVITENSSRERNYYEWFETQSIYEINQINLTYFEPYAEQPLSNINFSNDEPYNILFDIYEEENYYEPNPTFYENIKINNNYQLIERYPAVRISNNFKISNIINMSNSEFYELWAKNPELRDFWGNSLIVKDFSHVFQENTCGVFEETFIGEDSETDPIINTYYNFSVPWDCEKSFAWS